jgi:hypothetical protein
MESALMTVPRKCSARSSAAADLPLAVKKSGRRSVLLLLSDAKGELRFVAVPTS